MELDPRIREFYESGVEANRLSLDVFQLEEARTREIISRYLPGDESDAEKDDLTILDIGGGAGAYSFWLAQKGHRVHLVDPVMANIAEARRRGDDEGPKLDSIKQGDARALSFAEGVADMVLLLGPLYHLTERADRLRALREASRVLRPDGVMICAAISRFASMLDGFSRNLIGDERFVEIMRGDLADGRHENPTDNPEFFTTAFFHRPEELAAEMREAGFRDEKVLPAEGFGWLVPEFAEKWEDENFRALMLETLRATENEESLLGMSAHLLGVAHKSKA